MKLSTVGFCIMGALIGYAICTYIEKKKKPCKCQEHAAAPAAQ
jgi:hypothetical protein